MRGAERGKGRGERDGGEGVSGGGAARDGERAQEAGWALLPRAVWPPCSRSGGIIMLQVDESNRRARPRCKRGADGARARGRGRRSRERERAREENRLSLAVLVLDARPPSTASRTGAETRRGARVGTRSAAERPPFARGPPESGPPACGFWDAVFCAPSSPPPPSSNASDALNPKA